MLEAAVGGIGEQLGEVLGVAPIIDSVPVGPSSRRYANSALLLRTDCEPEDLLRELKRLERAFGRRPGGQRWGSRVLDLDIVLWDGGIHASPSLAIPHPRFREREFVLRPAAALADDWRDPATGLTLRQLHARLTAHRPLRR